MIKILEGENTLLSKQKLNLLIQEYTTKDSNILCKIINAESTDVSRIVNEYETQDMFSTKKLVILKRLLLNKNHKELIERFLEEQDPKQDVNLIIWEDRNIPKNTRYYKKFKAINAIESFPKFDKRTFQKWAQQQIDFEIDPKLLKNLMEMTNYDPYLFLNEIEKLRLMEKKFIDEKDLEKNVSDMYSNNIWEFIDSMNEADNHKKCTKILLNLLNNKVDPHYLMVMIARNLKQLLLISKMLEEEKNDREIVSTLKIPPFTLPKLKSIAKKNNYGNLLNLYEKIYNLNYETKIGGIEPELGLILLITRLN